MSPPQRFTANPAPTPALPRIRCVRVPKHFPSRFLVSSPHTPVRSTSSFPFHRDSSEEAWLPALQSTSCAPSEKSLSLSGPQLLRPHNKVHRRSSKVLLALRLWMSSSIRNVALILPSEPQFLLLSRHPSFHSRESPLIHKQIGTWELQGATHQTRSCPLSFSPPFSKHQTVTSLNGSPVGQLDSCGIKKRKTLISNLLKPTPPAPPQPFKITHLNSFREL